MTDWIQKRSSLLNNNTNNVKSAKSVDKELARLKNMGAVSSVWTNKFVQEDTSGVSRRQSYTRASTLSGSKNEDVSPVGHLQAQYNECQTLLDKANKDIEYYKNQVAQESEKSKQLEESSKQEASVLWFQCETLKTQFAQTEARLKKAQGEIESYKQQLAEQKDQHQKILLEQDQTGQQEAASLWFQCETLKTDFAHMEARLKRANSEIENYKQQLQDQQGALNALKEEKDDAGKDEAAALWFQCETLKTQYAHTEAQLKSAHLEIEAYKQQLNEQKETYDKALGSLSDEPVDTVTKDEAASLWFQCETLKTEFAHTEARLKSANAEIEEYKQQLLDQKETFQKTLDAMKQETEQLLAARQSSNHDEAAALWFQCETLKTEFAQTEARLKKANAEIESYKQQLEEQESKAQAEHAEKTRDIENSGKDEAAALWFQYEALKTEFAHTEARLKKANTEIDTYKQQLEEQKVTHSQVLAEHTEKTRDMERHGEDEAAALWFQYETLKTEFAHTEAQLKKANADIESYKQQLEEQKNTGSVTEKSDAEKDEAAALWFQCEKLKTEYAQTEARLKKATAEIESYKQQLEEQKATHSQVLADHAEKTRHIENAGKDEAAALWFQCETLKTQFAHIEARLKKANAEIETRKENEQENQLCVRQLAELIVKQDMLLEEYEISLSKLSQIDVDSLTQELVSLKKEKETMAHTITALRADLETSHRQWNLVFAVSTEIQNEFGIYKEERDHQVQEMLNKKDRDHAAQRQVVDQDLQAQITQLKEALAARDKVIEDLKVQRDAQVMDLTQTILDKDAQMMEMMNKAQTTPTESYFGPRDTPKLQMAKVREFMYSTSDDDDDDSDVLMMSYSDEEPKNYFSHEDNFPEFADAVSSPVSSTISFDSSDDAKHFSYASAKSRPVSTTTESEFYKDMNQRLSSGRFDLLKENWPIPPPTPPPNEPLPPVPRRARSRTVGREESPDTSIYRTSIHQTNELPRIIPLQRDSSS